MERKIDFKTIRLGENTGHGNARRTSLANCSYSLVALMDADDICEKNRFELQLKAFASDNSLSIVGGQITEFIGDPANITGVRRVPEKNGEILEYMKKRCPMNQVSVMFRKEEVEKAGGYIDWYCEEDYYLWIRMAETRCVFSNLPEILVNVRTGKEMASRRGGWKYFCSERKLQRYMLKKKIIGFWRYLYNVAVRFGGEIVAPDSLRQKLFSLLRSKPANISLSNDTSPIVSKKKENDLPAFSVSMCVYSGDNPEWFDTALLSVVEQTVLPDEIVLVIDGPIGEGLESVIEKYRDLCGG